MLVNGMIKMTEISEEMLENGQTRQSPSIIVSTSEMAIQTSATISAEISETTQILSDKTVVN